MHRRTFAPTERPDCRGGECMPDNGVNGGAFLRALGAVAIILGFGVVLSLPAGSLAHRVAGSWHRYRVGRVVRHNWPDVVQGQRLDGGDGAVVMVEFADYQCPHCRSMFSIVETALAEQPNVGIVYRDYPLVSIHPRAMGAATAALCAAAQGRFRQMHDALFTSGAWIRDGDWTREARRAGVTDLAHFRDCLGSKEIEAVVASERRLAEHIGVFATPTFVFADGSVHAGAMSEDAILTRLTEAMNNGSGASLGASVR